MCGIVSFGIAFDDGFNIPKINFMKLLLPSGRHGIKFSPLNCVAFVNRVILIDAKLSRRDSLVLLGKQRWTASYFRFIKPSN